MIEGIGQISVRVRDPQRAKAFYRDALGLPLLYEAGPTAFFACGPVRLMLGPAEAAEFDHPASVIYYKVADLDAAYAELRSRGVAFRDAPHRVYRLAGVEGWMAFLQDPDGNTLALMSERPA